MVSMLIKMLCSTSSLALRIDKELNEEVSIKGLVAWSLLYKRFTCTIPYHGHVGQVQCFYVEKIDKLLLLWIMGKCWQIYVMDYEKMPSIYGNDCYIISFLMEAGDIGLSGFLLIWCPDESMKMVTYMICGFKSSLAEVGTVVGEPNCSWGDRQCTEKYPLIQNLLTRKFLREIAQF